MSKSTKSLLATSARLSEEGVWVEVSESPRVRFRVVPITSNRYANNIRSLRADGLLPEATDDATMTPEREVAFIAAMLTEWEGVVDDSGAPIELTMEAAIGFLSDDGDASMSDVRRAIESCSVKRSNYKVAEENERLGKS